MRAVIELLDPFAARLGPKRAKLHLLNSLQLIYEVDDIAVQTHLAQIPIVGIQDLRRENKRDVEKRVQEG